MTNRLAHETSPYLLQHKDNPVDWYPWGPEALADAARDDKPLLVSIGYSACHWCHVMEHESFSNPDIATQMNERFVCVKVDREERPDIDQIYMSAVQAMTGHGGWPLNVFLTPDGRPFFGGTYWPPADRMGMPGFPRVLTAVAESYRNRRSEIDENADRLHDYLRQSSLAIPSPGELSPDLSTTAVTQLRAQFDPQLGGFGRAPKFPQPMILDFLLRYHHRTDDHHAQEMIETTLHQMVRGGMFDQIGGGFARYSVDAEWLVPHFEKMLYDNAQLARVYFDAYRAFGVERFRWVAEETLAFVARELTHEVGGFYSALDADSEGEEGRFYVWTPAEIEAVLGSDDGAVVRAYYGVTPGGNFEGRSILYPAKPAAAVAEDLSLSLEHVAEVITNARPKLLAAREERVRPGRDTKVITAWNGMMLRAFAEAAWLLDRDDFRGVAVRNGDFILTHLLRPDGTLARTWKDGRAKLDGFLEDYANAADGLLALYSATFDRRWLDATLDLVDRTLATFSDPESALLFDTSDHHEQLVVRPRELQDGATPSGNSVLVDVLLRLATLTGRDVYRERALRIVRHLSQPMAEVPQGFGRYLGVAEGLLAPPRELALAGDRNDPGFQALVSVALAHYTPGMVVGWVDPDDPDLATLLPFLAGRTSRDGKATAYLCERFACQAPVTEARDLANQLTGVN